MNIKKPLFFACILLSTSLIGYVQPANSQVSNSKDKEVSIASNRRVSKVSASREIKRGWKNFQVEGIQLQLPSYYEGGDTKNNPQEVLQRIEKAGVPSDFITKNFQLKDYDLFAINPKELSKGYINYVEVVKQEWSASVPLQLLTDNFAEGASQNNSNIILEKKVISLDNHEAGKVVVQLMDSKTNKVQGILVSYLFKENQSYWAVTYVTNSESQLQKQLSMFRESASTFRINSKT
jgi:hypothetical protein